MSTLQKLKHFHSVYNSLRFKVLMQWLSGRVLDSRPRAAGSSLTGVTALCPRARTLILA